MIAETGPSMREFINLLAIFKGVGSSFEVHRDHLFDNILELLNLRFGNSLDVGELSNCCMGNLS